MDFSKLNAANPNADALKLIQYKRDSSLGEQEIFLMGDNRIDSIDSRKLGPFKLHDVVGIFN